MAETRIHAELRAGAYRVFDTRLPAGAAPIETVHIVVTSPEGETVLELSEWPQGPDEAPLFALAFPIGTSRVSFETNAGLSGSCASARTCSCSR